MKIDRAYTGFKGDYELNPLQEQFVKHIDSEDNFVVSAPTASGKSTIITMLGKKYLDAGNKRIIYVGIMKALADEKYEDWCEPDHPWAEYEKCVISGDFKPVKSFEDKINSSYIICITPESLLSRLRHADSERNSWLADVGMIVFDEAHLVGSNGERGSNMESVMMEFTHRYPDAQKILLSATLPNIQDFTKWFENLNPTKKVHAIISDYRPVPLEKNYYRFDDLARTEASENKRIEMIMELISKKPDEQFLIGVWKKAFGRRIEEALTEAGIECYFHSADLSRSTRKNIESDFKNRNFKVLISTSTLFTGVNLPARNVVITNTQISSNIDIPVYEIQQAMGRAGRPFYDDAGFIHIFVPQSGEEYHINRIENGEPVRSFMSRTEWLATHFIGAVYIGRIRYVTDFTTWFKHTLAYTQLSQKITNKKELAEVVKNLLFEVINALSNRNIIKIDKDTYDVKLTFLGKIAAQFLLDPYHFSDLVRNMERYAALGNPSDIDWARAYASCSGFYEPFINKADKQVVPDAVRLNIEENYWKAASVVYNRLKGDTVPYNFFAQNYQIYSDCERWEEALVRAHSEGCFWDNLNEHKIRLLCTRIKKSCDEVDAELALSKFKPSEIRKLKRVGIISLEELRRNPHIAKECLSKARFKELIEDAD